MLTLPRLAVGAFLSCLLYPFDISPSFFEHFFAFWHNRMFQSHLVLSLPQPWNQVFLQGPPVPFRGWLYLEAKVWVLDMLIAIGVLLLPRPFQ